jgi:hypothetical protein
MDSFAAFDHSTIHHKRQQAILAIPTTYLGLNSGPAPGALVGIVLGSIVGFILVLYVIYAVARFGGGVFNRRTVVEEEIYTRKSHSPRGHARMVREETIIRDRSRRGSGRSSLRVRETTRGDVEAEVCSQNVAGRPYAHVHLGYFTMMKGYHDSAIHGSGSRSY